MADEYLTKKTAIATKRVCGRSYCKVIVFLWFPWTFVIRGSQHFPVLAGSNSKCSTSSSHPPAKILKLTFLVCDCNKLSITPVFALLTFDSGVCVILFCKYYYSARLTWLTCFSSLPFKYLTYDVLGSRYDSVNCTMHRRR